MAHIDYASLEKLLPIDRTHNVTDECVVVLLRLQTEATKGNRWVNFKQGEYSNIDRNHDQVKSFFNKRDIQFQIIENKGYPTIINGQYIKAVPSISYHVEF